MGDAIDTDELAVYTRLLKLSPDKCPPNHYDLLNVSPGEKDAKAIEVAARQQIERLRKDVSPDLIRAARIVLKRIQRAQTCLQDPRARASYDFALTGENDSSATESIWDELDATMVEGSATSLSAPSAGIPIAANRPALKGFGQKHKNTGFSAALNRHRPLTYTLAGSTVVLERFHLTSSAI